jgi:hypothetical protein
MRKMLRFLMAVLVAGTAVAGVAEAAPGRAPRHRAHHSSRVVRRAHAASVRAGKAARRAAAKARRAIARRRAGTKPR